MALDERLYEEQPLVSVVMCSYNGLPFIKEAVECIVKQTYKNWELVISDDQSSDGTDLWLKENYGHHPQVRLFFQTKNIGYVANKNFAHQQAIGTYITQLDNDDSCPLDRLEKQIQAVRLNPEIKLVASGYNRIDENNNILDKICLKKDELIYSDIRVEYPFWFPSLLIHSTVFERVGYFDNYFSGALGDDIYWTKKANAIYPIYCMAELLYNYRNNPTSITNSYGNIRKLIMPHILSILFKQQKESGRDWLMDKNMEALKTQEAELMGLNSFMSEQFRIWAAKAIDKADKRQAVSLLWIAFKRNPFNVRIARTFFYLLRT